jgi:glycosyltransferase involved in cell wall biosynthesis
MNVLFLDQFGEMGGAQRCLLDLLPAVAEHGGKLFAAIPGRGPMVQQFEASGADVREIPCGPYRSGAKGPFDAFRFAVDVARQTHILRGIARSHRIDLIYANGPRLWPAAARVSRRRIPVLCHAHNQIGSSAQAQIAGWAIRRSNAAVIACCEFAGGTLRQFARDRVHVVPNGVEDCGYRARDFGRRPWRIGVIGRIAPEKGQLEFVQAATHLKLPAGSQLVICGAPMFADLGYFENVRRAAIGLPIEFTGWREDIRQVLAGLDLLVIPSKQEAMPRVMIEAFSAGVPVVAFDVGGIREVITNDVTGFLLHERSAIALGRGIGHAMEDTEKLRRIAANARSAWERSYTLNHYRYGIMRRIEDLLKTRTASSYIRYERDSFAEARTTRTLRDSRSIDNRRST